VRYGNKGRQLAGSKARLTRRRSCGSLLVHVTKPGDLRLGPDDVLEGVFEQVERMSCMFTSNWEETAGKDPSGRVREGTFIVKLERNATAATPSTTSSPTPSK